MCVDQVEGGVAERQALSVGDFEPAREPLLGEVGARQRNRRRREIHAGDVGAALREAGKVDACPAADFEYRAAPPAVEVDESQQMVELFEVILIEVIEEAAASDRVGRDLEIVDVPFPVFADVVDRCHRQTII